MLVVHGRYFWRRKIVAYRNDYCLTCMAERMAFQHRTVDFLHIFWIPVVPLGIWKRWHCGVCSSDPHASPRTRRAFKWLGVVVLAIMTVLMWAAPASGTLEETFVLWTFRLGGPIATLWALRASMRSPADVNLKAHLAAVRPSLESVCPLCNAPMLPTESTLQCPRCGIKRQVLPAS
jgi:hypothetical protein